MDDGFEAPLSDVYCITISESQEALQELHAYVERGREAQQEEDMEELEALAARVYASSHRMSLAS